MGNVAAVGTGRMIGRAMSRRAQSIAPLQLPNNRPTIRVLAGWSGEVAADGVEEGAEGVGVAGFDDVGEPGEFLPDGA